METATDSALLVRSVEDPQAFAGIFDRHAQLLFRFLIRRVGRDHADELLAETFRIAFERRASFDAAYSTSRPWLYGIASNLIAKHRRREQRRLVATAKLIPPPPQGDVADAVAADIDARRLWPRVVNAVSALPDADRDALLLFAWEGLSYEDIAQALDIPVGTVRSRLSRARSRIRELVSAAGEQAVKTPVDRLTPAEPNDPWTLAHERDRLMSTIENSELKWRSAWAAPAIYPRLAYVDERAAIEFLTNAFGFTERREARMEPEDTGAHVLAWLEYGDGVVMIGHSEHEVHKIYSPQEVDHITCVVNVKLVDVDGHYEKAKAAGAEITMEICDAFWGGRRYEALDLEGHKWHFFSEPSQS